MIPEKHCLIEQTWFPELSSLNLIWSYPPTLLLRAAEDTQFLLISTLIACVDHLWKQMKIDLFSGRMREFAMHI